MVRLKFPRYVVGPSRSRRIVPVLEMVYQFRWDAVLRYKGRVVSFAQSKGRMQLAARGQLRLRIF